ncbi:MAG: nuclear transport factor 2 family protein [Candidatus Micrarchaeota archaeon]
MKSKIIIEKYFKALETGNYEQMIKLFTPDAVVHSPVYGNVKANEFYKKLFSDTSESKIILLNIFEGKDNFTGACHFMYDWKLANGKDISFECVDVFKFSDSGLIKELTIIYDASATRPALKRINKNTG